MPNQVALRRKQQNHEEGRTQMITVYISRDAHAKLKRIQANRVALTGTSPTLDQVVDEILCEKRSE